MVTITWLGRAAPAMAADGDLDPRFGGAGTVTTEFESGGNPAGHEARAVAVQPNGKIVAVGRTEGLDVALARYNPDGSLDPAFGDGGRVVTDLGGDERANDLAAQSDGKVVLAGSTRGAGNTDVALARYDADSRSDPVFGDGGRVVSDLVRNQQVFAVAVQVDDKLLAAGDICAAFLCSSARSSVVARYHPDGRLDAAFGDGGKAFRPAGWVLDAVIQPAGKIVATGVGFVLSRYNADGTPDATFGTGGTVATSPDRFHPNADDATAFALAMQWDGRLVAAGRTFELCGGGDFALARYLTGPAQPPPAPGFTLGATVASAAVAPGQVVRIAAPMTGDAATTALVDVEVVDPAGAKVHQQAFEDQAFAAGQRRGYAVRWRVPAGAAGGDYTIKVGVFAPGWSALLAWRDPAATFRVAAPLRVTFDDRPGARAGRRVPAGVIDWGVDRAWVHAAPHGAFATRHLRLTAAAGGRRTFALPVPRRLVSLRAYNAGPAATTVTLGCLGQPDMAAALAPVQVARIRTGWTGACASVTVASANGGGTRFDDLVLEPVS